MLLILIGLSDHDREQDHEHDSLGVIDNFA
jgi:hypothetical protein